MLGIYSGEHDNESACLLLARQVKSGVFYCLLFSIVILYGADFIADSYGLTEKLFKADGLPALAMRRKEMSLQLTRMPKAKPLFLSHRKIKPHKGYYNVSGYAMWANAIILLRVFVMPCASLFVLCQQNANPWWFLFTGEILTLLVWFVATGVYQFFHRRRCVA